MTYSEHTASLKQFIFLRILLTSFLLIVSKSYCSSQVSESINPYPSTFVFGGSFHHVSSPNNEARRYSLKNFEGGDYTSTSNQHRSSILLKVTGEFQFTYWFVRGGFGMRTEHANIEAHNVEEYYNYISGQTHDIRIDRSLYLNEKTTSLILSIEAGSYFFKRDRPIRFGMGAGLDFCKYLATEPTGLNQVNKVERVYLDSFSQEDEITESKHLKETDEWALMISDVSTVSYTHLTLPTSSWV